MPDRAPVARRLPLIAGAVVVALSVLPGAASAANVTKQSVCDDGVCADVVTFAAPKSERNVVTMTVEGNTITIRDENIRIGDATGCERIDDHAVRCVDEDLSDAKFDLGNGDDTITASPLVTVDGGMGNDRITGGKLSYVGRIYSVRVDLPAGTGGGYEEKDILSGITSVTGGDGGDYLIGDDAGNVLDGGHGEDTLEGRGGDDDLTGDEGDYYDAGDGDDTIRSGDRSSDGIDCGAGNDFVGSAPGGFADRFDVLGADCEQVLVLGLGRLVAQPKLSRGALVFKSLGESCRCALSVALLDEDTDRRVGSVRVKRAGRTLRVPLNAGGLRLMRGRGNERYLGMTVKRGRSEPGGYQVQLPPR